MSYLKRSLERNNYLPRSNMLQPIEENNLCSTWNSSISQAR